MGPIEEVRRRLNAELPRVMAAHEVPGVSVAVLVDGQTIEASAGVVNLRTGVEATPDALFMIQSITKVWTATLVMQLVDEGLVELDAPVTAYLPGFRTEDDRASGEMRVRHLLTHSGGFEGDIWAATTCGDDALQRFVDDLVARAPQHSRPGELFSYCSAGYGVLGRMVEVRRQLPYAQALRRYLTGPLGIEELAFNADEALQFRTAIGHGRPSPGATQRPLNAWAVMPPSNAAAGNQLAMSARGLIAFARMHLADGLAPDGTRILSESSARAMRERQIDQPAATGAPNAQGLGWMLSGRGGVVGHGGDMIGVASMLSMVPESGVAVALLANGEDAGPLIGELLDPLLGDLAGIQPASKPPVPAGGARVAEPQRYLGTYQNRQDVHHVTPDDAGRLWVTSSSRNEAQTMAETAGVPSNPERHELRPVDGDIFVLIDPSGHAGGAVEFLDRDSTGRARILHKGGRAAPRAS